MHLHTEYFSRGLWTQIIKSIQVLVYVSSKSQIWGYLKRNKRTRMSSFAELLGPDNRCMVKTVRVSKFDGQELAGKKNVATSTI